MSRSLTLMILIVSLLAACSGASTPKPIASSPLSEVARGGSPGFAPAPAQLVYDAYMDIEVSNASRAAERATDLAFDYGGYVVSSNTWTEDGRKHINLVIAVPAPNYESMRQSLLRLGDLTSEQTSGKWVSGWEDWSVYSQITVHFYPGGIDWPEMPHISWNPIRTFQSAFRVAVSIFGFLVDASIWALVVAGPFVLLFLGVREIIRRLRRG